MTAYRAVPESNGVSSNLPEDLSEFLDHCPACGLKSYRHCEWCGRPPLPTYQHICGRFVCGGSIVEGGPMKLRSCSEENPYVTGRWWWKKTCPVRSLHVHFRCLKCGHLGVMKGAG